LGAGVAVERQLILQNYLSSVESYYETVIGEVDWANERNTDEENDEQANIKLGMKPTQRQNDLSMPLNQLRHRPELQPLQSTEMSLKTNTEQAEPECKLLLFNVGSMTHSFYPDGRTYGNHVLNLYDIETQQTFFSRILPWESHKISASN
jgi:hypothetical protein